MKQYSRVFAEINLDAIQSNINNIKNNLNKDTQIMAVIKTDGYGHGAVPIAKKIENMDCIIGFAVATAEEAISLRKHNITKKILILGAVFEEQFEQLIENNITLPIYDLDTAKKLSDTAKKANKSVMLHLKLDTAMSRLGIKADENAIKLAKEIKLLDNIDLEGVFTHFATADEIDKTLAQNQLNVFTAFIDNCLKNDITFKYKHCSNSAAAIDIKKANFDFVRLGISLYGLYPSNDVDKTAVNLTPALSLKSCVCYLKEIEADTTVGYGASYKALRKTKVATIPVGYGDGYPRLLSNKGYVLINGHKAPIIGRVCMDQFMVDVTNIPDVHTRTEVILIGKSKKTALYVEQLSELCGRFNYEFVCDLGKRIPRVYKENGKIIFQKDYFND